MSNQPQVILVSRSKLPSSTDKLGHLKSHLCYVSMKHATITQLLCFWNKSCCGLPLQNNKPLPPLRYITNYTEYDTSIPHTLQTKKIHRISLRCGELQK